MASIERIRRRDRRGGVVDGRIAIAVVSETEAIQQRLTVVQIEDAGADGCRWQQAVGEAASLTGSPAGPLSNPALRILLRAFVAARDA
ncbi:MAG: hypothetical protein ABIO49_15190 [Dokdonella sp.]